MSATDTKPLRKQKPKLQPAPNGAERLKTVVRRLPPNLPEEIFWQSVQAWVTDDTVTWKSYCPGKWRTKRLNKEGIPSRAYIAFRSEEQVATFSREYDGHLFRDKAGNESQAIVEFAPFQKVPAEKKKVDARNNTIDKDDDYLSFLETLKSGQKAESVSLEALIAASQLPPPPTTTPLLEALKAEKSAQKDREAILRNHAHYKDAGTSGAASKKEEAKKKAAAAQQAAKQAEPPTQPLSKKARKAAAAAAATAAAAVQKTASTSMQAQAQDGQSPSAGRQLAAGGPATAGHAPRHRPPKERSHPGKGDIATPPAVSSPASVPVPTKPGTPAPVTTEAASAGSPAPSAAQGPARKGRPTIGLGRQFEAALSGTGVAVGPSPGGDRRKRDKGGESATEGVGKGGKQRGERAHADPVAAVVPSILQRPEVGGQSDMVIMQRPQSPRAEAPGSGPVGHGEGGGGAPRGGGRRGRGRGRGGHRGG